MLSFTYKPLSVHTPKTPSILISAIVIVILATLSFVLFWMPRKHTNGNTITNVSSVSFNELMDTLVTAMPPPDGSGSGRVAVVQRGNPRSATPISTVAMKGAPAILGDYLLFPYDSGNSTRLYTPYLLHRSGTKTVLTQFTDSFGSVSGVAAADGILAVTDGKKLVVYNAVLSEQSSFIPTDITHQATSDAFFMPLAFSVNSQLLYIIVNFTDTSAGGCGAPQGLYEIDLMTQGVREIGQAPECTSASSPDRRVITAVASAANVAIEDVGSTSSADAQLPSHKLRLISLTSGKTVYEMRATADDNWDVAQQVYVQGKELALSLTPRPSAPNGFIIMNLENHAVERHDSPDSLVNGWAGGNFVVLVHIDDRSIAVYDRTAKEIRSVLTADDINTYQYVGFWG